MPAVHLVRCVQQDSNCPAARTGLLIGVQVSAMTPCSYDVVNRTARRLTRSTAALCRPAVPPQPANPPQIKSPPHVAQSRPFTFLPASRGAQPADSGRIVAVSSDCHAVKLLKYLYSAVTVL